MNEYGGNGIIKYTDQVVSELEANAGVLLSQGSKVKHHLSLQDVGRMEILLQSI